jgi:hypothetical protein
MSIAIKDWIGRLPFPLKAPAIALETIAIGKVVDRPHIKLNNKVHVSPINMDGFRPNLSEALPQSTAVTHCAREKTADVMPAHFATSLFSTPKPSIISGYEIVSA